MYNNKSRGGGSGGYKSGGGKRFGGGERPMMHGAICNKCKAPCEVPFRPNGKKPIFCSNCFKRDDAAPRQFDRSSSRGESNFSAPAPFTRAPQPGNDAISAQLTEINDKLDALIDALMEADEDEDEDEGEDNGKK